MIDKVLLDLIFQQIQTYHPECIFRRVEDRDGFSYQPTPLWAAREDKNYFICVGLGKFTGSDSNPNAAVMMRGRNNSAANEGKYRVVLLDLMNEGACCSVYGSHIVTERVLMDVTNELFIGFLGDLRNKKDNLIWAA